ncbi:MAG: sugar-binding protein [Phycisphaerae bacterium]
MIDALPRRALFRFELPVRYLRHTPPMNGSMRKWTRKYLLPPLVELEDEPAFADAYAAWNEEHLFVAFDVPERRGPLRSDPTNWWKKDGLRVCVDTRDARDIKRATRFCHFFYFLPTGGGTSGRQPVVGLHRMSRAKEPPPNVDVSRIQIGVQTDRRGYALEAAIPAACLNGWDPAEHPRLGFFYKVKDTYHGSQHLTVNDELGWNVDPSTWATAVLVR